MPRLIRSRKLTAELTFDRGSICASTPQKFLPSPHFVWDTRTQNWRAPAWRYSEIIQALAQCHEFTWVDRVLNLPPLALTGEKLHPLRADQKLALDHWSAANSRGLIVMPTGTGKTEVALTAMQQCQTSTLIVSPIRDLMYQWHRRIQRGFGIDAGILGDGKREIRPITVTTYDSAFIHMDQIGHQYGLVIFDEVHHLAGLNLRQAAELCPAPSRLGLTATLERTDGQHSILLNLIGPIVYRQEVSEARGRTLAQYESMRIPVHLTASEQRLYDQAAETVRTFVMERRKKDPLYTWQNACADSARDPLARRALRAFRFKSAIEDRAEEKLRVLEDLFRLHPHERILIFAGSNTMAMDISRRFLLPVLLHYSRKDERQAMLAGLADGHFRALVANQVLDEGIDLPEVKIAIVVGGLASTRQAKQRLGRILRKSGSARAVLYEIVCIETREKERSKQRQQSDAYAGTRLLRDSTLKYRVAR